jgi:hypothetical protein
MSMGKAVRFGMAAALLATASPALASDFSGVGRLLWWALAAGCVLIAVVMTVIGRMRGKGTREGALILSGLTAVTLAPALLLHVEGQWIPTPFPALAIALLDGSAVSRAGVLDGDLRGDHVLPARRGTGDG